MLLSELTGSNGNASRIDVRGLTEDSRLVEPGFLFAAFPGVSVDRREFIPQAIEKGAVAILGSPGLKVDAPDVFTLEDRNPRQRFAVMAARFFVRQPDTVVAVTGTNGKTSVADFVRQIWTTLGIRAGSIGTLGVVSPDINDELIHTTPDPVRLHSTLAALADDNVDHVAMEASSHGLDQYRMHGVRIVAAALTNVTRDHLNYHADFDAYLTAKLRLFGEILGPDGTAVINADDGGFEEAETLCWGRGIKTLTVGRKGRELRMVSLNPSVDSQKMAIEWEGEGIEIELPLPGAFQASNALIAAALAIAAGEDARDVFGALETLKGVRGRLERVGVKPTGDVGAPVYVDYAHTPDALGNLLNALRPHAKGRLHIVFGAGGDRDEGKRAEMGDVAAQLADAVIITDDNPRTEDPAHIRAQVMSGITNAENATEVGDRSDAISFAIDALVDGDLLVVAGKGHESGQEIGDVVLPFDDAATIRRVLGSAE